jgi:serine/threonine protein kinase
MRKLTIGGWQLGKRIGRGGSADVYAATRKGSRAALKILRRGSPKRLARFHDEIAAMQRCVDIPGVMRVLEFHVPGERSAERAWVAMTRAQPIKDALDRASLAQVVEAIRDVAYTLTRMHARGVTHRDIKPENLFRCAEQWSVGDFGLADFEGKLAQTQARERIGAVYYIPGDAQRCRDRRRCSRRCFLAGQDVVGACNGADLSLAWPIR